MLEVKIEPQGEAELPATGDYRHEEQSATPEQEEESGAGDESAETAVVMTPTQS